MGEPTTAAVKPAGNVIKLEGSVTVESQEGVRQLSEGSPLFKGETLITGDDSKVEIKFTDGTHLSQGENSRISVDAYVYDADKSSASGLLLNMAEGTFRCVTGKIVKENPENFILKSPLATLGIRGTTTVSEIHGNFEKHGAENISQGKTMVVQDAFGTVRFITQPQSIIDFEPGKPIGMPRTFTPTEQSHFHEETPFLDPEQMNTDEKSDDSGTEESETKKTSEPDTDQPEEDRQTGLEQDPTKDAEKEEAPQQLFDPDQANKISDTYLSEKTDLKETPKEIFETVKAVTGISTDVIENTKATFIPITNDKPEAEKEATGAVKEVAAPVSFDKPSDTILKPSIQVLPDEQKEDPDSDSPSPPPVSNHSPEASDSFSTINEDKDFSGKASASDPDGDALSFSLKTGAVNGIITSFSSDGTFSYTPNADFFGQDSFIFEVTDEKGGSSQGTVLITVSPVNDPPSALAETHSVNEDEPLTGNLQAKDIDTISSSLVYQKTADPVHGSLHVNPDGSFTYLPDPDYHGNDQFSFSVEDDSGGHSEESILIQVNPVNDAPTATDGNFTLDEDGSLTGVLGGSDPDSDPISFEIVQGPKNGVLSDTTGDGHFTFTPASDFIGEDQFTFSVKDEKGLSDTATVFLSVNNVNDPPVVENTTVTMNEDQVYKGLLTAVDPEAESLTFVKKTDPSQGLVIIDSQGNFTYTPHENYHGQDRFSYEVIDEKGGTSISTVDITVTPVNDMPVATGFNFTTQENNPYSGTLTATDIDGDTLLFSNLSGPVNGTLSLSTGGAFSYTPPSGFSGTDSFTFKVDDGKGGTDTETVSITVTAAINNAPLASDSILGTPYDTTFDATLPGTDPDGDLLTFTKTTLPSHGTVTTFSASTGFFTYDPDANFWGKDFFNFSVTDTDSASDSGMVTIAVGSTSGNDTITGTSANDTIYGLDGNDQIDPGIGNDFVQGDLGDDHIKVLSDFTFEDTIDGGVGIDTLEFMDNNLYTTELTNVTNIEEVIIANQPLGANIVTNDSLIASGMTLSVDGTGVFSGAISWNGSAEADGHFNLTGGFGNDSLIGGAGDDTIDGYFGNDTLYGGGGNDGIYGDSGNDSIQMGSLLTFEDTIDGGTGSDTLTYVDSMLYTNELLNVVNVEVITPSTAAATDIVTVVSEDSLIASGMTLFVDGSTLISGGINWDGSAETNGHLNIAGGSASDTLTGGGGNDTIDGNGWSDTINGGPGDDLINGDWGSDEIKGGEGSDALTGGTGNDIFTYTETTHFGDVITDFNQTLGDQIKLDVNATGLFSQAISGAGIRLVNTAAIATFFPLAGTPNAQNLFSAANNTAFVNSVKSVQIGTLPATCLAFGLVGTGASRKLMAGLGQNTDGDTLVDQVTTFTIATLQNLNPTNPIGPAAFQIEAADIILY